MGREQAPSDDLASTVTAYRTATKTPGVSVAVVALDHANVGDGFVVCAGDADVATQLPVSEDTVFAIGSLTKVFTAAMVALAVVRGRASLTDPVADALAIYPGFAASKDLAAVELIQLATHTAGFPDLAAGTNGASENLFDDGPPDHELLGYWASYQKSSSRLPACWRYSNTAFVTLGFAVASLLGETTNVYNDLLATNVSTPLGLTSTSAHPNGPMATGYVRDGTSVSPTGSVAFDLKSSGADMLRFLHVNIGAPSEPNPTDLQAAITLTQAEHGSYPVCAGAHDQAMGLAWQHPFLPHTQLRTQYKNGAVSGFSCAAVIAPDRRAGVVVLTNLSHPNDDDTVAGPTRLANQVLASLVEP